MSTKEIDKLLTQVSNNIFPVKHLSPDNEDQAIQDFLEGEKLKFTYPRLEIDLEEYANKLHGVEIPNNVPPALREIYKEKLLHKQLEIELIANRKKKGIDAKQLSRAKTIYGAPQEHHIELARKILRTQFTDHKEDEETITSEEAVKQLQHFANVNKIKAKWSTSKDREAAYVHPSKMTGIIPDKPIHKYHLQRLQVHENGTHLHRATQGSKQPYAIFKLAFPNYDSTEEGLAVVSEMLAGLLDNHTLKKYAARILASHFAHTSETPRQVYQKLLSEGVDQQLALRCMVRAVRGGGFAKDHIYLQQVPEVLEIIFTEDAKYLYTGKIGIRHIPLVRQLQQEGIIKAGKVPSHIQKARRQNSQFKVFWNL